MIGKPHRIVPRVGPQAFKTYSVQRPLATHWRPATCEEVDCPAYLAGWVTLLPVDSDKVADLKASGRRYTEHRGQLPVEILRLMPGYEDATDPMPLGEPAAPGALVAYYFAAGQPCFRESQHRAPIEREGLYIVRDGDWRGNPLRTRPRVHTRPEHWVEDFAEHQDRLKKRLEGS